MIPTEREIDQIAEYADASVRGVTRRGSLAPIRGRRGVNAWLYGKWGRATAATRSTRSPGGC